MYKFGDLLPAEQQAQRKLDLHLLIVTTIRDCGLCAAMTPILVLWILFSTPTTRKQPVFWIQLCAILLAHIATAIAFVGSTTLRQANPLDVQVLNRIRNIAKWLVPLVTDIALIFRLLAFYPCQLASRRKRALIVAFPVSIKIPRLAAILAIYVALMKEQHSIYPKWMSQLTLCEFALQTADSTYVSAVLFLRIHRKLYTGCMHSTSSRTGKRTARLLLEASTMTFAPAVVVQLALCGVEAYHLSSSALYASNWYPFVWTTLFSLNMYVSVLCSLLATSWSALCSTSSISPIMARSYFDLRYNDARLNLVRDLATTGFDLPRSAKLDTACHDAILSSGLDKSTESYHSLSPSSQSDRKGKLQPRICEVVGSKEAELHQLASIQKNDFKSICARKVFLLPSDTDNHTLLQHLFDDDEPTYPADRIHSVEKKGTPPKATLPCDDSGECFSTLSCLYKRSHQAAAFS